MNRKKFAAITLALLMTLISIIPATAQEQTFRDVPASHFAFEAINWVSDPENGAFMVGDAGNNFHPNRNLNRFEAAHIFALAAGFRHVTHTLSQAQRDELDRSFETWRPFLDSMAEQYSRWQRTADREIAFLLYRGILTTGDVQRFVTRTGQTEQFPMLTRQEAVVWMVRLVGRAAHAQAVTLPHHTPFRDDSEINPVFARYIYYAKDAGIIQGSGGYMNPTGHFTRAEMAMVFYNALADHEPDEAPSDGAPATITGTIANVHLDTHVSITSAAGTETFAIERNAVIMIDNVQRTPAFLRTGMPITALVNAQRNVISLVARSEGAADETPDGLILHSDEGFITEFSNNADSGNTVTISTRRVGVGGNIIEETRTFTFAPNAVIARGGAVAPFDGIIIGEPAFFRFTGYTIHELNLLTRNRAFEGELLEIRTIGTAAPVFIIQESDGPTLALTVTTETVFARDGVPNTAWNNLRVGDTVYVETEYDRLVSVRAEGTRLSVNGRLTEMHVSESRARLTISNSDGVFSYYLLPGTFDVFSLRVGMQIGLLAESREVVAVTIT